MWEKSAASPLVAGLVDKKLVKFLTINGLLESHIQNYFLLHSKPFDLFSFSK